MAVSNDFMMLVSTGAFAVRAKRCDDWPLVSGSLSGPLLMDNSCTTDQWSTCVHAERSTSVVAVQMIVPLHKHCINTSSNLIIADMSGLAEPLGANRVSFAID